MLGGIGITWEHDAHLYLRRAYGIGQALGDRSAHLRRITQLSLDGVRRTLHVDLDSLAHLRPEIAAAAGYERGSIGAVAAIAGPYDFLPLRVDTTEAAFGEASDKPATQPINRVDATAPPMILLTGTADEVVVPANADRLAAELRAVGVPVEVVRYEGVGHNGALMSIARPFRGYADILGDVDAFFERIMAGAPPSMPSAEQS